MPPLPSPERPPATEVRYEHPVPETGAGRRHREVEGPADLEAVLARGESLAGLRFQGLNLTAYEPALLARQDLHGLVVLGGRLTPTLDEHLRAHGAIIFPTDPAAPVRCYRGTLYTAEELYAGLAEHGYAATPDARAYAWSRDATVQHDAYVSALRALHDDAMADALVDVVHDRRVVGVMGGHGVARGTAGFHRAAGLGHVLAERGVVVATGGGPGAMEAANLGAWAASQDRLDAALERLATVPHFAPDIGPWAAVALAVRTERQARPGGVRSIGIPTWHYGHEPPNVFGDRIAKFFSNALREDLLLHHSGAGLVVLPGAAGTTQEVFQMATRLYYEVDGRVPPLVLVDRRHWTEHLPVWPLLQALGRGRRMGGALHLVDDIREAAAIVLG